MPKRKNRRRSGNPAGEQKAAERLREMHAAQVRSIGAFDAAVTLEEDVLQELLAFIARGEGPGALAEVYRLSGHAISATARVEMTLAALVAFLLNPLEPGRVRNAVLSLDVERRLDALRTQNRDWVSRRRVTTVIKELAEFRNKLAHRRWQPWRTDGAGGLEWGAFLEGFSSGSSEWVSETVTQATLVDHMRRASVVEHALSSVIHCASQHYMSTGQVQLLGVRESIETAWDANVGTRPDWWDALLEEVFPRGDGASQR